MADDIPALPYAGTSGWSGSEASRERAEREDRDGTTSNRQATVLGFLTSRGAQGATWRELAQVTGWHHGQATGALSALHKGGLVARLHERRERCSVYVVPEHVGGRATAAHGRRNTRMDSAGTGECSDPAHAALENEIKTLRKRIARVEEVVQPKWRSYSYTRNDLIDDIRRALV